MAMKIPIEDITNWRKASKSEPGSGCVDVGSLNHNGTLLIVIRDTKDAGTGPAMPFSTDAWARFTFHAAAGHFGYAGPEDTVFTELLDTGSVVVSDRAAGTRLEFTANEWSTFTEGVLGREFTSDMLQPA